MMPVNPDNRSAPPKSATLHLLVLLQTPIQSYPRTPNTTGESPVGYLNSQGLINRNNRTGAPGPAVKTALRASATGGTVSCQGWAGSSVACKR